MEFSLITYNIWSGKYWKKIINFLREKSADAMCLQEVGIYNPYHKESKDIDMCAELRTAFPDYNLVYAPIGKRLIKNREESFGNAILTKFPVSGSEIHYLLRPLRWTENHEEQSRNILEADLLIKDKIFTIVTGHLTYAQGFNDTDDQIKEAEQILKIIKGKSPLVFAGDYNSHMNTKVFGLLKEKLPVSDNGNEPTFAKHPFSYNGFTVNSLQYKIDHILATENVRISNVEIIDVPYSDHLPIMAKIEFA